MTKPYRSTPVFDDITLPAGLRARHTTKAGVWGMVCVLEGKVKLTYLEPPSELLLDPDTPGPLLPEQPHFVEPIGAMKMRVDFYHEPPGPLTKRLEQRQESQAESDAVDEASRESFPASDPPAWISRRP